MSDLIEPVGARLTLLNGPAFRAGLAAATDALQAFNDEQERAAELADASQDAIAAASKESSATVVDSSATAADAVKAQAAATVEASETISAANAKVATSSVAAADTSAAAWKSAVGASTKILKYASVLGAVVVYEGVKKYMSYNQAVTQLGVNAGLSARQLPGLAKGFLTISDATGLAATNVAQMAYYLASANPALKTHNQQLLEMTRQAANLNVLAGSSANPTAESKAYGAIVSNAMSLTSGSRPLTYSTAGGKAINEWINAVTGHGDITVGGVTSALGTGILPVAKTFGVPLNTLGAWLDVLTPAMGAASAATRLKTAIGMLGAPSAKAAQAFELFGGNITTAAAILRSKGGAGLLSYLNAMTTGRVTGSTFASAFYGGGLGTTTGGTKGVGSGAGEYLRVLGFTPAQANIMEGPGGIASFAKMTPTQLAAAGFARGTTGSQAEQTVRSAIVGGMFGGGRSGAAIMQLMNEAGTATTKQAGIVAAENPKTYAQALALAFGEPTVTFNKFKAALENLTISVGKDVTPALDDFMGTLLKIGKWFSNNKWALNALGVAAGSLVAGAAVVKTVSVGEKMVTGTINIAKFLTGSGTLTTSGTSLTGAATKLGLAAGDLSTAADMLMGKGGVPGVGGMTAAEEEGSAVSFGTIMARVAGPLIGVAVAYVLAKYLSSKYGKYVPSWLHDQALENDLSKLGNVAKSLGLARDLHQPSIHVRVPNSALTPAQRVVVTQMQSNSAAGGYVGAQHGVLTAFDARLAGVSGVTGASFSTTSLNAAAKKYAITADSLKTAADDQKTAAQQTDTTITHLSSAAQSLDMVAQRLNVAADNAASAFSPGNIHALNVAGTKTSIARK